MSPILLKALGCACLMIAGALALTVALDWKSGERIEPSRVFWLFFNVAFGLLDIFHAP